MKQKICKDCKFCIPEEYKTKQFSDAFAYTFAKCSRTKETKTDVVGGEVKESHSYCSSQRNSWFKCGPWARLFKSKNA